MNNNFIISYSKDISEKMKNADFKMLYSDKDITVFLNKVPNNFNFSEFDLKKIIFTDKLFF